MSDVLKPGGAFPIGTTVGAYLGHHPKGSQPGVAAATTAAVQSDGSLTFTGLTAGQEYTASASLSSTWPTVYFTSGEDVPDGSLVTEGDLEEHTVSTAQIEDDAVTAAKVAVDTLAATDIAANAIAASELADNAVDKAAVGDDAVGQAELDLTIVSVTVLAGASTGTATVVASSQVVGFRSTGNQDQFIDNIAISGTTLTVTLAANATANNTFDIAVLEP